MHTSACLSEAPVAYQAITQARIIRKDEVFENLSFLPISFPGSIRSTGNKSKIAFRSGYCRNPQVLILEMYAQRQHVPRRCRHSELESPAGLCIVTVGNSLRGDDGIASALCQSLPETVLSDVCLFNLGPYTSYLSDCLKGHKAAIIIDSTCDGLSPGSVSIVDLHALLEGPNVNINSSHGFSVADELKLAKQLGNLPNRLIFFGVEIGEVNWKETISPALKEKLPLLVSNLAFLVQRILETLRKNA